MAEFSYYGVGVSEEIVAYGGSAIDDYVGQQDGVVSYNGVFVDHYIGADVRVLADLRGMVNHGAGMNSGGVARRAIEKFDGLCPSQIRVRTAQHSRGDCGKVLGDDDGRRLRGLRGGVVLRIRQEG